MLIRVHDDLEATSAAAAGLFVQQTKEAIRARGQASVCLAGGSTPRRAYEILAGESFKWQVQWDYVHVFFGDERCVPPDDPQSNYRMAREALLSLVPIPAKQIHPIRCAGHDEAGALAYEELLRAYFGGQQPRFDLVFLGMGDDGHTASLFPGTAALSERERWAVPVCPPSQELCRVTLTAPLLNQARTIAFLVSGLSKASTVAQIVEGPPDPLRLPSQLVQPRDGDLLWLLDREAASGLSRRTWK